VCLWEMSMVCLLQVQVASKKVEKKQNTTYSQQR
jgi:hypothetical protein